MNVESTINSVAKTPLQGARALVIFGAIPLHGQERANIEVIRTMTELGLEASFIIHRERGHEQIEPELNALNLHWIHAEYGPLVGRNLIGRDFFAVIIGVIKTSWIVWRQIKQRRPTHLYLMNWLYMLYAGPAIFLTRTPVIYRLGDSPPTHTRLHRLLWKLICRRFSFVVCVSKYIHQEFLATAPIKTRSTVIYSFPPARPGHHSPTRRYEKPRDATAIVYVGQISKAKGIPQLVAAAEELLGRGRNIVVWIAGDYSYKNPMAERLIAEVAAKGLDNRIQFLGYVDDVPGLMSQAKIHVCPSVDEDPLPNVVLEAKRAALATVAFPSGGIPELIENGKDGLLCSESTGLGLAEALDYYVINNEARQLAGALAKDRLEHNFGYERYQQQWAEVFLRTWRRQ